MPQFPSFPSFLAPCAYANVVQSNSLRCRPPAHRRSGSRPSRNDRLAPAPTMTPTMTRPWPATSVRELMSVLKIVSSVCAAYSGMLQLVEFKWWLHHAKPCGRHCMANPGPESEHVFAQRPGYSTWVAYCTMARARTHRPSSGIHSGDPSAPDSALLQASCMA